jgi:hypothetical protein
MSAVMQQSGVRVVEPVLFQDAPVVPPGIRGNLSRENVYRVFDVGGNAVGARMIGQYSDLLSSLDTIWYFAVNPYRAFSGTLDGILESLQLITASCGIDSADIEYVSNPCIGDETTVEMVLRGHCKLEHELASIGKSIAFLAAERGLAHDLESRVNCPVFPLTLHVRKLYHP